MSEFTHEVPIRTRISKVCDSDASRYALGNIHVTPTKEGAWLSASDGRCMAAVHEPGATAPTPVLMPASISTPTAKKGLTVRLNGRWESSAGKLAPADIEGRFPACDKVFTDVAPGCVAVTIDPRLLAKLGEALANSEWRGLTLFIPTGEAELDKGCVKTGIQVMGKEGIGVIMPIAGTCDGEKADDIAAAFNVKADTYRKEYAAGAK